MAEAAVERVGDELDVWLLPTLAYTKSNEHAWSPGTVWLSATTMLRVLDDIGRCVATTPARRLVFFNGHGGNSALLGVANREMRLAHGLMTFLAHPACRPTRAVSRRPRSSGMGIHGGTDETSLMLHLAPDLVDMSLADAQRARAARRRIATSASVAGSASDGCPTTSAPDGVHRRSDARHGRARRRAVRRPPSTAFGEALAEIAAFDFGR